MRTRWLRSLALSLGFLVLGGAGVTSLPTVWAEPVPSVVRAWPPTAPPKAAPAAEEAAPAVSLERPVAIHDYRTTIDSEVRPAGLFNRGGDPVVYSPAGSLATARPLPVGPSVDFNSAPPPSGTVPASPPSSGQFIWRQTPSPSPLPPPGSSTTINVPVPDGSVYPSPQGGPGICGVPIGNPMCDGCCANGCGASCGDSGCGNCWGGWGGGCCFGNRWYGSAEYLLWFVRGQPLPPLATSGLLGANPPGALGQPGTNVLFGGDTVSNNPVSGGRIMLGYWFSDDHCLGLELGGFGLAPSVNRFSAASGGTPFLARPFVNALTGAQDIEAVATPNGLSGMVSAVTRTQLWGAQANVRSNLLCGCNWFVDGLVGWRYLNLNESLQVQENLGVVSSINPNLPAGSTFVVTDRFATQNVFNGAQIGTVAEYRLGRWSADLRATVALGVTQQIVDISGSTLSQAPGQTAQLSQGGLLAQSTNIGRHVHEQFGVVPEIGLNIGYQFTNHIRGFVGYNFLYWSSVVRAGNQIDPVVNPNLIPPSQPGGPARPGFDFHGSDFWAQGIQFGLDIRW